MHCVVEICKKKSACVHSDYYMTRIAAHVSFTGHQKSLDKKATSCLTAALIAVNDIDSYTTQLKIRANNSNRTTPPSWSLWRRH